MKPRNTATNLSILLGILGTPSGARAAGPPRQLDAGEIQLALGKLAAVGSVLYVAAHPDDENTSLLSYLGNGRMLRTAYLSVTRGDGGQNLIGPEQGAALGVIRTQELLAARRIDGAEQFFTRARDFGFSKSAEETLRIWGKDDVLADVVWVIRRFRPDVVINRFSAQSAAGQHGHHVASARLTEEAFRLAADPAFRPEQLAHVKPWQARRLLWNRSSWSIREGEDLSGFLRLDVGGYNPLLGLSYGEMAAESRSMHKSQGFGVARNRGPQVDLFKVLQGTGDGPRKDPLEGIEFGWRRFAGTEKLSSLLSRAARELEPAAPERVIPLLLEADAALAAVPDAGWREHKRGELADVLAACAGLHAEAFAAEPSAAPGEEVKVTAVAMNRSSADIVLRELRLPGGRVVAVGKALAKKGGPATQIDEPVGIPAGQRLSNPYWLDERPSEGLFRVADAARGGEADSDPALAVELVFSMGKATFSLPRPVAYKWTDPVAGERSRLFEVTPAVAVEVSTPVLMFPDRHGKPLNVLVKAGAARASGTLRLELPAGWKADPASAPFQLSVRGEEAEIVFSVRPPQEAAARAGAGGTLRAVAEVAGARLWKSVTRIEYPHIPMQTLLADAEVRLVPLDLKRKGNRVGYVVGAGDEVPASLRLAGYDVTILGEETLAGGSLEAFDAIVVGVRAYNTNPRMQFHHKRLMRYVEGGGTVLVQYNTQNRQSQVGGDVGPYPFEISRDRVTDETAPVAFADPRHRLLTTPNRITARDFEGWVQERGLYFAGKWDPRYETILAMSDPGEGTLKGSVLVARHGKGTFVYTGLAFFRQLPAGVPGAFRLFANLIATHGR